MDVARPLEALLPTVDSSVLSVLAGTTAARTGREIARAAGRSQPAVQAVLDRLVEQGLAHQQRAGRSFVYKLNRDHLAAPAIEALAAMRPDLFKRVRDLIETWQIQPLHASIFGSAARGDGDVESDIDFFLVRPKQVDLDDETWRQQLDDLSERVRAWTGNSTSLIEVGSDELDELRRERRAVLDEIRSDAIDLAGRKARQVIDR